ncbi:hypothetical protein [Pseudomonas fluorescens]|jgi:hypothetical protein|uniref:Uncharacterized protein n=1 Tax=Pseudomonas fluorescens TaxID=294 RepID=A0A5E7DVW8_PSEFL|nr:hypothetical protein [Pseudomonas fluorescens]VVO20831.1 hypothetical protein PS704_04204 [Pseudomonas fluorescens]
MSFFNQRGIFLQLLAPSIANPREARVSMQLARKELGWDPVNELSTEALVDSVYVMASSNDGGRSFSINVVNSDVDGDGDINSYDKDKLLALAKAYSSIVNP